MKPNRSNYAMLIAAAMALSGAMRGAGAALGSLGGHTLGSIRLAGRMSPQKIAKLLRQGSPVGSKGARSRKAKHKCRKQPRRWRRVRAAGLRKRRRTKG